jgi:hypothetical protein
MEQRPSALADLLWSLVWIVLGAAIVYGSWTMDRLEKMHIDPLTAPGLVPGVLGGFLVVMGTLLMLRSARAGGLQLAGGLPQPQLDLKRLGTAFVLCVGYAAGLVGHGLPFWAATTLFVAGSIVIFQWPERRRNGTLAKGVAIALACGVGAAAAVTLVFQELFLVRLP